MSKLQIMKLVRRKNTTPQELDDVARKAPHKPFYYIVQHPNVSVKTLKEVLTHQISLGHKQTFYTLCEVIGKRKELDEFFLDWLFEVEIELNREYVSFDDIKLPWHLFAQNPSLKPRHIDLLLEPPPPASDSSLSFRKRDRGWYCLEKLAKNPNLSLKQVKTLYKTNNSYIHRSLAQNPIVTRGVLKKLASSQKSEVLKYVAKHKNTSKDVLQELLEANSVYVRYNALLNPKIKKEEHLGVIASLTPKLIIKIIPWEDNTYEKALGVL